MKNESERQFALPFNLIFLNFEETTNQRRIDQNRKYYRERCSDGGSAQQTAKHEFVCVTNNRVCF